MRLLITGSCGFVGSTLARCLCEATPGIEIWGIDNFMREGSRSNEPVLRELGVRQLEGDIRNARDLARVPPVDWVIDCAANPSVMAGVDGNSDSFELMDHNLIGTLRLLEFCKQHRSGFILVSTSRVYSIAALAAIPVECRNGAYVPTRFDPQRGLTEHGISERFPSDPPASLYGISKRCSELLALEYSEAFNFPVWINRCGVLAGPGQFGRPDQGIFSYWIRAWRERRPLRYIGFDGLGSQVRDCLDPRDLIGLLVQQLRGGRPKQVDQLDHRICNFSGGMQSAMSLRQLSEWCEGRFGVHDVALEPKPRPYDLPWIVLDSRRASSMWGWRPTRTTREICGDIADSLVREMAVRP